MKIIFGSDHAGYALKEVLKELVLALGHEVEDMGAATFDPEDDYPDYITPAAKRVAELSKGSDSDEVRGIILGGSGQGEAIAANRIKGVRAVVYYGPSTLGDQLDIVALSREHNNANVLSLGARALETEHAKEVVTRWLLHEFSRDPRHIRRIEKIDS